MTKRPADPGGPAPGRGWFITFEGPEGVGKTTQAALLRDAFAAAGRPVLLLREPGGTGLGEAIRSLLLDIRGAAGDVPISPRADALLFNAARAQLVEERIRPALAGGVSVVCGRFADSTLAYQGYGMGLPLDDLAALERFATGGLQPDLTLLIDLPVEIGLARKRGEEETRFEAAFDGAFHGRVRDGFLALAAAHPGRFVTIDGRRSLDEVGGAVRTAVVARLGPIEPAQGGRTAQGGPAAGGGATTGGGPAAGGGATTGGGPAAGGGATTGGGPAAGSGPSG